MMSPLTIELSFNNHDAWTLKLIGSVDVTNHHLLWRDDSFLEKIIETEAQRLEIDLTAVDRFDSQGLRYFYDLHQLFVSTNIEIILKNPNSHLDRLLQIMQFDKIFKIQRGN